jgi:hypothetical protein
MKAFAGYAHGMKKHSRKCLNTMGNTLGTFLAMFSDVAA